ncbi:hypothetical protein BDZ94DRAFT_1269753 [Collybia nuda]|uniref:RING-type domain-containing protein n=1 Tax=Collybia nuda TaxID=64659 RepID=A0A9P5XXE9_9AGAR|nr:hypothetical protein BDZ94DRAFT_1269753 [Collybia nuda]
MASSSPFPSFYSRRFRLVSPTLRLDSIEEYPEYDLSDLNLGAESPRSVMDVLVDESAVDDQWAQSGIAVHTNVPTRDRGWRSSSFSKKRRRDLKKEVVDRDCGICFEIAVSPSRTLCCGKLFCLEHITDWLHGSSSDGRCPSCEAPCSLESDTFVLSSPILSRYPSSQPSPSYSSRQTHRPIPSPLRMSHRRTPSPSDDTRSPPTSADRQSPHPIPPPLPFSLSPEGIEILSRLASLVGLTLLLYALLT